MENLRKLLFLNEDTEETCSFTEDDENIRNLDKQSIIMLVNQIKLFLHRIRINDLLYNGKPITSTEIFDLTVKWTN